MSDLTQLYQEIILRHNKSPLNYGTLDNFTGKSRGHNPLCGDEVTVYWSVEDDRISRLMFRAQGCAISRASASMMTELLRGKTEREAENLFSQLREFLQDSHCSEEMKNNLGELAALSGVRKYPSRINCATLAWHTFLDKK